MVPSSQAAMKDADRTTKDNNAVMLPFVDDFSDYVGNPSSKLWQTSGGCFINKSYGVFTPSVGVATLDAIDAWGVLYDKTSSATFNADTLCSKSIRLDSVMLPYPKKLTPADSVILSFYFQPGGGYGQMWQRLGVTPNKDDSLVLEFYDMALDAWEQVWQTDGMPLDSLFASDSDYVRYVTIVITDEKYFNADFRFRFRNFATLEPSTNENFIGNCDQWNLDYVYLDANRSLQDSTRQDLAFVAAAPSLLKEYQSMPCRQYREEDLAANLAITITNLDSVASASRYMYRIVDNNGAETALYDGGFENLSPFVQTHQYQTYIPHCNPPVAQQPFGIFDTANWSSFSVIHTIKPGVGQDSRTENDTIKFIQRFENFFAYDDGTAEQGIGVEANANSHFAVFYNLKCSDTLTAVDIYFNSTARDDEQVPFYLCVWNDENGIPKDTLYRSEQMTPHIEGLNKYYRYMLRQPLILDGRFYVSLQSKTGSFLNIGFDENNDASSKILGFVANRWEECFLRGAAMIRPYFGSNVVVGLDNVAAERPSYKIYPNPATEWLHIEGSEANKISSVELFNSLGRKVYSGRTAKSIDVSAFSSGFYVLCIRDDEGLLSQYKVIIK
jgi:hypothetical protein